MRPPAALLARLTHEHERQQLLTLAERRQRLVDMARAPHDGVSVDGSELGGRPCVCIHPRDIEAAGRLLWLHGGGYVMMAPKTHLRLGSAIALAAGCDVYLLDYRLAPEHPLPAALDDAAAAIAVLAGQPGPFVVAGDSAGGGLAIAALLRAADDGERMPAGCICLSPWVDLTLAAASLDAPAGPDPFVGRLELERAATDYLAGLDPRDPRASPVRGDLSSLPPLLIHVGTAERLFDDALGLARAAEMAAVPTTLEQWRDMIHVWHLFDGLLPEADQAIARIGTWLRVRLTSMEDTQQEEHDS